MGCSELEGEICVDLRCRKTFESAICLDRQYVFILSFIHIFTILGLFDVLFGEHVSNNNHVFFSVFTLWENYACLGEYFPCLSYTLVSVVS